MKNRDTTRFSFLSIGLHWLTLVLLVAVYATMEFKGIFPKGSDPREAMKSWHYVLGLSVFAVVWIRLVARLVYTPPAIQPPPPKWQTYLAAATHVALYLFMILMPLIGWTLLSMEGKPVLFLGFELPALTSANPSLADSVEELHETIGTVGYFLIGLHTAAALFHHYAMRDNTLRRMSPFGGR